MSQKTRTRLRVGIKCTRGHLIKDEQDLYHSTRNRIICRLCGRQDQWRYTMKNVPDEIAKICELCGRKTYRIHADHDNETKLFRGWLCLMCNAQIISFIERIGIDKIIAYLNRTKVSHV